MLQWLTTKFDVPCWPRSSLHEEVALFRTVHNDYVADEADECASGHIWVFATDLGEIKLYINLAKSRPKFIQTCYEKLMQSSEIILSGYSFEETALKYEDTLLPKDRKENIGAGEYGKELSKMSEETKKEELTRKARAKELKSILDRQALREKIH